MFDKLTKPTQTPPEDAPVPTVVITFNNPTVPDFEFLNWRAGISMGTFERVGQMLIRAAQRKQAELLAKLRHDESERV